MMLVTIFFWGAGEGVGKDGEIPKKKLNFLFTYSSSMPVPHSHTQICFHWSPPTAGRRFFTELTFLSKKQLKHMQDKVFAIERRKQCTYRR